MKHDRESKGGRGRSAAALVAIALVVSACSTKTLTVHQADAKTPKTMVGVPYPLTFNAFTIAITRRVVSCNKSINVQFKAEIKPLGVRPDPQHIYTLDPNSLAGLLKTSEVKLEYHPSGAPKSLNASAEDKTGAVIANIVSIAATISKLATIPAALPAGDVTEVCTPAVMTALTGVKTTGSQVEASKQLVQSLSDEVKLLMAKIGDVGNQPDAATKRLLSQRYDALKRANDDLTTHSDELAKHLKVLTDTDTVIWPEHGNQDKATHPLDKSVLARWLKSPGSAPQGAFTVALDLRAVSAGNSARTNMDDQAVNVALGIPYRAPVPGVLRVCRGVDCPALGEDKSEVISRLDADIVQLGHIYQLECKSRPFSSIGCAFELTDSGQLKSVGTTHKAALAEGASAAAKGVVQEYAAVRADRAGQPLKELQTQVAFRKAQAELAAAEASLAPNEPARLTGVLKAETDLIKAELAKLEAEEALREARLKAGKL